MFRRLRETGPGLLVPLAWIVVAGAHADLVSAHAMFVAHVVMAALLATFAITGWSEMSTGVLRTWRTIVVVGFAATVLGVAGFVTGRDPLLAVSLYAWMGLPALGLLHTGRAIDGPAPAYLGGGTVAAVGAVVYAAAPSLTLVGVALVGLGQTAGIADAVLRY
ncbi:hypothetical protein EI982_13435 [Haloplanus rallus]|jgi:hypothetical protein|uniref:Uncharacterized protein n=1 Tax=Haloplanus rallus TaxID=1816183 RepID=A0A6B9F8B0_9EURY|nr:MULTISPECIES: hypothetical protein [Haloplanus]QGX95722.1 hypothetical protein EI982_13435 [Haloplanus rallus]